MKKQIKTDAAPQAIGPYSQAVRSGNTVYISGQIPLDPVSQTLIAQDIESQVEQAFANLQAVANAAGGSNSQIVKVNIYLIDLKDFNLVNQVMKKYFEEPFPARAAIQAAALPKGAQVEIEAIMELED